MEAVQEFHHEVTSVVGQVLDQYQQLFGAAFQPGAQPMDPGTQEHRRRQLLGELNYSGKYFALKEQMKVRRNRGRIYGLRLTVIHSEEGKLHNCC